MPRRSASKTPKTSRIKNLSIRLKNLGHFIAATPFIISSQFLTLFSGLSIAVLIHHWRPSPAATAKPFLKPLHPPSMLRPRTLLRSLLPLQSTTYTPLPEPLPYQVLHLAKSPTTAFSRRTLSIHHRTHFTTCRPTTRPSLLAPQSQGLAQSTFSQSRGMKVRSSVKKLCDACKVSRILNGGGGGDFAD